AFPPDSYNPTSIGDALMRLIMMMRAYESQEAWISSEALKDEEIITSKERQEMLTSEASRVKGIRICSCLVSDPGQVPESDISKKKKERVVFNTGMAARVAHLGMTLPTGIRSVVPFITSKENWSLEQVIYTKPTNKKAAVHQVSTLPFPFSNIHQFEGYIRQPVGHTWNPPSSFRSLTEPRVVTKAGKMIEPIDPEDVVLDNTTKKEPQKKKRRKKVTHEMKAF
ncbi:hypothetical protein AVEN_148591-2-1, partial [Araneus ventricosus]